MLLFSGFGPNITNSINQQEIALKNNFYQGQIKIKSIHRDNIYFMLTNAKRI